MIIFVMIFKVDFGKTYDSVSWSYLSHILSFLGLSRFGGLRCVLKYFCASILINGMSFSCIKA